MTQDEKLPRENEHASSGRFPVVAFGASAGGLEAIRQVLSHLPVSPGVALVMIVHLDPERPSMLTKVLEGSTPLPVLEAKNAATLEVNRVYVIPPGSDLTIRDGLLFLLPRRMTGRLHLPIDSFFRALAADAGERAIGVVLSGSGADGTEGLKAIRAEGGIAICQEPDSAQFGSMPENAIAAGAVDFRGRPEHIARELVRLSRRRSAVSSEQAEALERSEPDSGREDALASIFSALRQHAGVDFSGYKRTTVARRIARRLALHRTDTLTEYAAALRTDPAEARALARDFLIHVTSFFRDEEAFDALKELVFKALAQRLSPERSIRIWVPGCSTGEEAYALTICLLEAFEASPKDVSIKVFGTDLSEEAIETARQGVYSESALADISPQRLNRFFRRIEGGRFRIDRFVRDLCVFVKHDLIRDPPLAKIDLISCRNVLIYFDAELQRRIIPTLHYCLNPHGHLFLGQSETITGFRDLFAPVDKEHRIFVKTGDSLRLASPLPSRLEAEVLVENRPAGVSSGAREAQRQADHLLLTRFAPPGVIVNDRLEVVQFRGRTGDFLEPAPGQPQANVLRMARSGLEAHLYEALGAAKSAGVGVRREGLQMPIGSETQRLDLEVLPLNAVDDTSDRYFLVLFIQLEPGVARTETARVPHGHPLDDLAVEAQRTRSELIATKDYLQTLITEHQSTSDEFAAANEELQATNEELQSAKEELQATNEELSTVNDQLRQRNLELDQLANDLVNVLSSVEIPVIIVDLDLRVRRFTPTVKNIAGFIPADIGRPIEDLRLKLHLDDLTAKIREVLDVLGPKEWEVRGDDGRWFRLQIRPYRTSDNRLNGAVLSFVDVDDLKNALREAERARDYATSIVETVSAALVVLDYELRVVSANQAFFELFAASGSDAQGRLLAELEATLWREPALARALAESLAEQKRFTALEFATSLPRLGKRRLSLSGRPILWGKGGRLILLAIEDVTAVRSLESERALLLASEKQARIEAERATRAKDLFLATLSHELRTPLSAILMSAQLLKRVAADDARIARSSAIIERAATTQSKLIDDLLDVSRIVSGKLMLELGPVDFAAIVQEAVDLAQPAAHAKNLTLRASIESSPGVVFGDAVRLLQVVSNLLTNATKFTPAGGSIFVTLAGVEQHTELTVRDTGIGIHPEILPQLFARFVQADSSVTRKYGGLGLGLSIVRHIVEAHGGEVHVESPGEGQGSTFRVLLPLGTLSAGKLFPAPASGLQRPGARDFRGVRVLFVEDDPDTRESHAAMLAALGADVRAEPSVAAALTALRDFQPQVIISDIAMPEEDGFSFIQKVRLLDSAEGGAVPAAALTALANDEDRRRALNAGFQLHVPKPVDASGLATIVGALLDWDPADVSRKTPR